MTEDPALLLEQAGIKPTPNRILVLRTLLASAWPMSLVEIETELQTLDKSSVFRALSSMAEKDVVHSIEDGRGITKYEACNGHDHQSLSDMHAHFYCEKCHKVYCLNGVSASATGIPDGFEVRSVNYMLKGICPECTGA